MSAHRYLSSLLLPVFLIVLSSRNADAIDGYRRADLDTEVVVFDLKQNQTSRSSNWEYSLQRSLQTGDGTVSTASKKCRALYPYSFGGLDEMSVVNSVKLLQKTRYPGIAVRAGDNADRIRLRHYYRVSQAQGDKFSVFATFMSHKFKNQGVSIKNHKATINVMAKMARQEGVLWMYFRDDNGDITQIQLEQMVRKIVRFAEKKRVRVALYPHVNNVYAFASHGIELVEKINRPNFGIVLNLNHEILAGKSSELAQTVERIKHKLFGVNISGASVPLDKSSNAAMIRSSIHPLYESEFDLKPFLALIRDSGYSGPIGFLNHKLEHPEKYLEGNMEVWEKLCSEVGLYE